MNRKSGSGNGEDLDSLLNQFEDEGGDAGAYSIEQPASGMIESLDEETLALSQRFHAIVSYITQLGEFFNGVLKNKDEKELEEALDTVSKTATHLTRQYSSAESVVLRYRGRLSLESEGGAGSFDYTVQAGQMPLDVGTLKKLVSIDKNEAYRLGEKLGLSFHPLRKLGVYMLSTTFKQATQQDLHLMRQSLRLLARYFSSIASGQAARQPGFMVFNEHGKPDANLVLLAGVNNVKSQSMQELVNKVGKMLKEAPAGSALAKCVSVYDAIFLDPQLRQRLARPPVEMNNPRRMIPGLAGEWTVSQEHALLLREISSLFDSDPLRGARTTDCLFLRDYRDVNSMELLGSLDDVSDLLVMTKNPAVKIEALKRIRLKLDKAPDYLMDAFSVKGGKLFSYARHEDDARQIQPELLKIVAFFKKRSETNEKIHKILYEKVEFDASDVQALALDLGIAPPEAAEVLALLQKCFKTGGQFVRGAFERNIPFFAKHEKKLFEMLWSFLKDIGSRDDRVALLDSLSLLISKMKRPDIALDVILTDFIAFPENLDFSERNGLMLANVLIRKYNKELGNRIERTPEEVLLVREGISEQMARFIADFIDREQDRFLRKMRTIHEELVGCIGRESDEADKMSLKFLVSMEREIYILLSLSSGLTGRRIIRSAVREYGDPRSNLYGAARNQEELKSILQLLQLAVRSLGRFGSKEDAQLFERIKDRAGEFMSIKPSIVPKDSVKSVMEHVTAAIASA